MKLWNKIMKCDQNSQLRNIPDDQYFQLSKLTFVMFSIYIFLKAVQNILNQRNLRYMVITIQKIVNFTVDGMIPKHLRNNPCLISLGYFFIVAIAFSEFLPHAHNVCHTYMIFFLLVDRICDDFYHFLNILLFYLSDSSRNNSLTCCY